MSYTPPAYTDAGGNILTGYTPPAYTDAGGDVLGVPTIFPSGIAPIGFGTVLVQGTASFAPDAWVSSAFGSALIFNYDTHASLTGFAEGAFGTAWVSNFQQFVTDASWTSSEFGTAQVYNSDQIVENGGWRSSEFGNPTVFDPLQTITEVGNIAAPDFPGPSVADFYQFINPTNLGIPPSGIGAGVAIGHRVRYIAPPWFHTRSFGDHIVELVLYTPEPWISSAFGTAAVYNLRQYAPLQGIRSTAAVGVPDAQLSVRRVYPRGRDWSVGVVSRPEVYNKTQVVTGPPFAANSPPSAFGGHLVVNRNRSVETAGFFRERFGNYTDTWVRNKARAIVPPGLTSLTWGPETFVAHRIRYVYPSSWESSYARQWNNIYNNAFLIASVSVGDSSQFGRPDPVFSNLQGLRQYDGRNETAFGTAFIAPRIRTVVQRTSMPASVYSNHTVRYNPYPIRPAGIAPIPFGYVTFFGRPPPRAQPRSFETPEARRYGRATVANRNRALAPEPGLFTEYGRARVFNRNTHLGGLGSDLSRFGAVLVEYRTKTIRVANFIPPAIPLTHWIRNLTPNPPETQYILVPSTYIGQSTNVGIVSEPLIGHPTIYPDGWVSRSFGTASVQGNGIRPRSFFELDKFGEHLISSTQWMYPESMPISDFAGLSMVGRPQCSPHTIYAPYGELATEQARRNHPSGFPHYMDHYGELFGKPWFGNAFVSTTPRYVAPENTNNDYPQSYPRFGDAAFTLRKRFLFPSPIRGPRFGPVIILNVPQFVGFNEDNPGWSDLESYGTHVVSRLPLNPHPIDIFGEDYTEFGDTAVDLKNREITPEGIPHRGNPEQGLTNPWGLPEMGWERSFEMSGTEMTLWGTLLIEHFHRQVWPTGWESLSLIDDSLNDFRYRMRITRRNPVNTASGIPSSTGVGTPTISFRVRDMIVNAIWPGYVGMPRIGMSLTPAGWDSFEVGDIDEWVAGTVKAHGDEMFSPGYPRLGRGVQPASIDDGAFGDTRPGWLVSMAGMPPVGFDGPSITDEYGCSRRVVTTWPIQAPTFPEPVVTT